MHAMLTFASSGGLPDGNDAVMSTHSVQKCLFSAMASQLQHPAAYDI